MQLTAKGKFIDTADIRGLFTQGERYADRIHILVDTVNNDVNVSDCTFVMRTVASDGSMTETLLQKQEGETQLDLLWDIPDTVTAVPGLLQLELVGSREAVSIIKYKMPPIYIKEMVMGAGLPVPDVIEEKLARMNQLMEEMTEISEGLSGTTVQEVLDARTSSISGTEFGSLSQRLTADFNTCVTQGELESALGAAIIQANNTGVGRFWRDENGVAHGEIFGDYANNIASAAGSSASGYNTQATGSYASTDGAHTQASGGCARATGSATKAAGDCSYAGGSGTVASADFAWAVGYKTTAAGVCQHVFGCNNIVDDASEYILIIGNDETMGQNEPTNGLTLDWDGNLWTAGDVTATDAEGGAVSMLAMQKTLGAAMVQRDRLNGSEGADLNTAITTGMYRYTGAPANHPITSDATEYGVLTVMALDAYIVQTAYANVSATGFASKGGVFVRTSADGGETWSAWRKQVFEDA